MLVSVGMMFSLNACRNTLHDRVSFLTVLKFFMMVTVPSLFSLTLVLYASGRDMYSFR